MRKFVVLFCSFLLLLTACPEDLSKLKQTADRGDVKAQYDLGVMYHQGKGVQQDYALAFQWHEKAAQQGFTHSQVALGKLYYNSHGVEKDKTLARQWWKKAAEQGNENAQAFLRLDDRVEQDKAKR